MKNYLTIFVMFDINVKFMAVLGRFIWHGRELIMVSNDLSSSICFWISIQFIRMLVRFHTLDCNQNVHTRVYLSALHCLFRRLFCLFMFVFFLFYLKKSNSNISYQLR